MINLPEFGITFLPIVEWYGLDIVLSQSLLTSAFFGFTKDEQFFLLYIL